MAQVQRNQPDIDYYPDLAKYELRSRVRLQHETLETQIPPGCPIEIHSETVWDTSIVDDPKSWLFRLEPEQIDEICAALKNFKGSPIPTPWKSRARDC